MNDPSDRSGSNTGVVIAIVVLVLAVPCCGGLTFVGAALLGLRVIEPPWAPERAQPAPVQRPPLAVPPVQPQPPVVVPDERGGENASEPAEPSIQ